MTEVRSSMSTKADYTKEEWDLLLRGAFDDYSITSGRVVTGTNPASGRSATERGVNCSTT
jgi:hypothetical protein